MLGRERGCRWLIGMCVIPALFLFLLQDPLGATESKKPEEKPIIVNALGQCLGTEIIDHIVKNDRGEKLGEVDDLLIERSGKIEKGILSVGDYIGVGYKLVAVSFTLLKIDEKGNILYPVTKEQLEKDPAYAYKKDSPHGFHYDPDALDYQPDQELYPPGREKYYPYPMGRIPFSPDQMTMSSLIGRTVINNQGEPLGTVDDFVIRFEESHIEKIIVSTNKIIKEGSVALPFRPLEVSTWGIYYNITKEQMNLLLDLKYMENEKIAGPEKPQ